MKNILTFITIILLTTACAAPKIVYVPTQAETIIEYRDSTIYVRDTVRVPVPAEEKQIITKRDSSHLETTVAISDAWIDEDYNLNHKLRNKKTELKAKIDTCYVIEYVDKFVEREVINEVEVPTPYIPKFAWFCIIFTCCWAVVKIAKIIWKFKSGGL